ncbi:MAG TPA: AsmA family protein [Burkholderiaceae bacterium]|nr:AsmA family protein [Burkholderiaceae bacterium]
MGPSTSRWKKRLIVAAAVLALLIGGGYAALEIAFPPERIAALAGDQVSARTGRDFRIDGTLSWRVLPRIAVVADRLVLGNAPWGSRKEMVRVQRAAFELELWPLLQGDIRVGSVELDGVDVLLEVDRNGEGNWVFSRPAQGGSGSSGESQDSRSFELDVLRLRDAVIGYRDARNPGVQRTLALNKLDLDRDASGSRIDAQWTLRKQDWRASGQLGTIAALLADTGEWPFDLELTTSGARIVAKGQLLRGSTPPAARLSLDARVDKPSALAPWLDAADRVPLPLELKSTIAASGDSVRADPLTLSAAGQALAGRATWRGGDPWRLDASLKAGTIDLANVLPRGAAGASGAATSGAGAGPLFGDDKLPFDDLPEAIAKVDLRIDQLRLPDLPPLSALTAKLVLEPGVLRVDPLAFGVAGGKAQGGFTLRAGAVPKVELKVDASGMSAEVLAQAAGRSQVGGGRVQLGAALAMTGNTPRALAAGANGDLLVSVKDMTLAEGALPIGSNLLPRLLQIVQPERGAAKTTTVECAVARLPLKNGVATVDRSIAAETSDLTFSASGRIDLRDQTLELAIRPGTRKALGVNPAQLASLVVAKGPIRDPKLTLDAKGAANLALAIGAAAATGGWSALASGLAGPAPDPHPCVYALTGVEAKAPAAPAGSKPAPKQPAAGPEELRKLLRGIFK